MTDLERFVELYRSFGIECKVNHFECQEGIFDIIELNSGQHEVTSSIKFDGYGGFFSDVFFDKNGNFIKQGFWE